MLRASQVNVYVEDIEAAADFYRGLLGFTETFRTPQQGMTVHVELRLDGFTLGLATIESLRDVHGVTAGTGPPRAEVSRGPTMWMRRPQISAEGCSRAEPAA
jgi:lactoylglutathione lyase